MSDKAVQLTVSGAVVGVNFRNWAKQQADRLGVGGWVRNNVDRTVTIEAEGPAESVDQFVEFVRRGPEQATIEAVDVREAEIRGLSGFSVEY